MVEAVQASLDGLVFVGEIGEQGKAKGDQDEFVFQDGTFRSAACDPYGFTAAPYATQAEGDAVSFESETVSPTDGRMVWRGTINGGSIEGTATWHKPQAGSPPEAYWFRGIRKQ